MHRSDTPHGIWGRRDGLKWSTQTHLHAERETGASRKREGQLLIQRFVSYEVQETAKYIPSVIAL